MKTKNNVLFVVRALPFEAYGTLEVIRKLLAYLPNENYFVLGRRQHAKKKLPNEVKQKMFQILNYIIKLVSKAYNQAQKLFDADIDVKRIINIYHSIF